MHTLLEINWGNALTVTFFGFMVVVMVLVLLILVLLVFGKVMSAGNKTAKAEAPAEQTHATASQVVDGPLTEAESAAVAMALYQYCYSHDEESYILTIKQHETHYEPWNSSKF